MDDTTPPQEGQAETTATVGEKLPIDQLAQMDNDKGLIIIGIVPIVVIAVLAIIFVVLHYVRRGKNWNELGEAMRLDDAGTGSGQGFTTQELAEMEPTKPSQRLHSLSKSNLAEKDED